MITPEVVVHMAEDALDLEEADMEMEIEIGPTIIKVTIRNLQELEILEDIHTHLQRMENLKLWLKMLIAEVRAMKEERGDMMDTRAQKTTKQNLKMMLLTAPILKFDLEIAYLISLILSSGKFFLLECL